MAFATAVGRVRRIVLLLAASLAFILTACSSLVPPATPTRTPLENRGRAVFESYCERCHSTNPDTVIVGPSLAGVAIRAEGRIAGLDARAYILDSITNPGAYTVEGFQEGLMPTGMAEQMPPEDLEAVIAYLLTLK